MRTVPFTSSIRLRHQGMAPPDPSSAASPPGSTDRLPPRDLALLVILGVIWGSAFAVIRFGLLAGAAPLAFGVGRFSLAAVLMAALALARREPLPSGRTLALSALLGGGLFIGAYAAFLYIGEQQVSAGYASILIAGLPLWSVAFSYPLLPHDRVGAGASAGLVLGFLGVVVLFLPDLLAGVAGHTLAAVSVLVAGLFGALGSTAVRKWVGGPSGSWGLTVEFVAATALLGAFALAVPGETALPATWAVWGSLLYLAAVASVGGYTIYFYLLHRGGPTRANLVAYINPVSAVLLGVAFLAESVTLAEIAGLLLIASGVFLVQREGRARARQAAAARNS